MSVELTPGSVVLLGTTGLLTCRAPPRRWRKDKSFRRAIAVHRAPCARPPLFAPFSCTRGGGGNISFVRFSGGRTARGCCSISGSPGDTGWCFFVCCPPHPQPPPPPTALLGHPAILHLPAALTDCCIEAIHQEEGNVRLVKSLTDR